MSLCINPDCSNPSHPQNSQSATCQACGSDLLLQGRYRVMRLLSDKTGFGTVYEAYERDLPKILKVLKRDRSENPKVLDLFQKEAEVLSQLHHPGVPFIDRDGYFTYLPEGSSMPLHCIMMENIDGPNLQQWMQQQGNHPIGERQAFQWLMQLIEILQRVHQHNYFHRDIKPDNVMLRSNGQLVLVDFGAAREMTQTYLAQVGSLGVTTVSSAGYTPPEQEQGQAVPQSDFYATGRTIIYLLTGRSPNDTTLYDPMLNTFNWRAQATQVSSDFADLLDSLIAPRVIDRPKTAQEILERLCQLPLLQQILEADNKPTFAETSLPNDGTQVSGFQMPAAYGQITQPQQGQKTQHRPSKVTQSTSPITGWTWLIASGVTFAVCAVVGIVFWQQQRRQAPPPVVSVSPNPQAPVAPVSPLPVELLQTFPAHQNSINALKLLSDRRRFISASADATIRLWDLSTGAVLQTYEGHNTFVNAIALSPDEKVLYSGGADGAIYQWDLATGQQQAQFTGHTSPVNTLDRTPDGQFLVSGASDGTMKLWDTKNQAHVNTVKEHNGAVNILLVTRDGQRIITGGTDRTIKLWDLASGDLIDSLEDHESYINALAVSPDGRILFSASADATIKRWDLNTGVVLDTLLDHTSYVNVLTLSRDGQTVSSGSADATVRVWDVKTGQLLAIHTGFDMPVDHVIQPSEKQLVTASRENPAIKAWLTDP
ncbi:MAG: protein kinase [Leptolyngbya sp. SIO1D8]|nr:protein kinase [Leptolyngbya sp. SIO1D8]